MTAPCLIDEDGWVWISCPDCGWQEGPFLGTEDAEIALAEHRCV